jgi:uncharacterized protein YfaS (alpha-2-macroglobulin family)
MSMSLERHITILAGLALFAAAPAARAAEELRVTRSGPTGEIAQLQEANEIRVVFSEPMVALGRIPQPVSAPFFKMTPAVRGAFRWSGTQTLIFTPERPLPFATRHEVTIDAAATSVAGRRLAQPHRFAFTTPTVRLLSTSWYRRSGRYDAPLVIGLRFNQPVKPSDVAAHVRLAYEPHAWLAPQLPADGLTRLFEIDPRAALDFEAKVGRTRAATQASGPVAFETASEWDRQRLPPGEDLLVLVTREAVPTDAWIQVRIGPLARGVQGHETPGMHQLFTIKLEPTFFVTGLRCSSACDPDGYNPIRFTLPVRAGALRAGLRVSDLTDGGTPLAQAEARAGGEEETDTPIEGDSHGERDWSAAMSMEDAGYSLKPAREYLIKVDKGLRSTDGQRLGYTWLGRLENWHQRAFTSFGSGHGVWEKGGGPRLPYYARNVESVREWLAPVAADQLVPAIRRLRSSAFSLSPDGGSRARRLAPRPDAIQSYGLDLAPLLSPAGSGVFWTALDEGQAIPRAYHGSPVRPRASLVQVTNLGISVKDSPHGTLVFVTRLDTGEPVESARVAIRDLDNRLFWSGTTDASGLVMAPDTDLRDHDRYWDFRFVVTAEKDGDLAYAGSDWHQGVEPWTFGIHYDLHEAKPVLRGTVFADRGVYKLGEEVRLKAVLRSDTAGGMKLLAGTRADVLVQDSQGKEIDRRSVALGEWSSAEWALALPEEGSLGRYAVSAKVDGLRQAVTGGFLVAAYRRPEFRVDATLSGETTLAGAKLAGSVTARYLFGSPMAGRPVRWTLSRSRSYDVPRAVVDEFPAQRYEFLPQEWDASAADETHGLEQKQAELDDQGRLALELPTERGAGRPYLYTLEGDVSDVSRQAIAGRASFRVDPAPWYVGLRRPPFFVEQERGLDTEVVAVDLGGRPAPGVVVRVSLAQVQWHGVRRAEGHGYYTWEPQRRETPAGEWTVSTGTEPSPLRVPFQHGGQYVLRATASDGEGRSTTSSVCFYVLGSGYTAWQRHDHNRIELVPEKKTYRPGDTARLLIKSPWERATALLTTEREGVRSHRTFSLASTQETVSVEVTEADIPNVYVSVLLVKGRTVGYTREDASDPGKPAFRLGYAELKVEDARKRLRVGVTTDAEEYRPAASAEVAVTVTDHEGGPAPSEVTLWAVDHGVLSLTAYRAPDVLGSVWVSKALQVMTEDSRLNIVSRRVLVSKGADEGGGGGLDLGPGTPARKDFRALAFWIGSLVTDAHGRAIARVSLPETLTTYRIMAVAGDKASRFGWAEREVRTSKPVLLQSAFPRFLALGDTALFGPVLHSRLTRGGTATVTASSLDPGILELAGETKRLVEVGPKGSVEVRFDGRARSVGRARVRMSVSLLGETDALEEVLPVRLLSSPEVTSAYGQARPDARETIEIPRGVVPEPGGLHVETASTAMVGLGEGARYLVDYPYGCAEQRASAALALVLAADLGEAFRLPGIEPSELTDTARATLRDLESFQCEGGGFAYWKGGCHWPSPYLTSYVLHVFQRAETLRHPVRPRVFAKGYAYLEAVLGETPPTNESWWPAYTAWQAFAVRVLTAAGRSQDSHVSRLYAYADRMPVFALAHLLDSMGARGERGERPAELLRRIENAILVEGGASHVEELSDPHLLWFWNSNVRSTAYVLGLLVRRGADEPRVAGLVRWLMHARKNGRWGNTQENAVAMESLVDYYRRYESETPDFAAVVRLGLHEVARPEFRGRSTVARNDEVPMKELLAKGKPGDRIDLTFRREGTGTLHYAARLKYASHELFPDGMDQGFAIERAYAPAKLPGTGSIRSYKAGDLVRVTLRLRLTKERRYVAVSDPLPAGFEPVESWFATTATDLAREQREEEHGGDWTVRWRRSGFDHVERHDDRVLLFATRLGEGEHVFSYVARATTAGRFRTAPARVEEMYSPEVFGRTATDVIEVQP